MTGSEPPWVDALRAQGMHATWAGEGRCWVRFKRIAHLRYPTNDRAPLPASVRRDLFWRRRMAVLQYHEDAGEAPANAVLYLCADRWYSLESLSSNNRSKVRRALKQLEVRQVTAEEIIAHGYPSYLDTRTRHGSEAMDPEAFRQNWERQRVVAHRELWAAWAGEEIAAFGAVHRCGRWASISATVSDRRHQRAYPNHALFFTILQHLMADPEVESVSYGLSSLRSETARDSLHHFKESVGLAAVPVVRRVEVHPLLRPAVNRATLGVARAVEARAPGARIPRSARAALEFLLDVGDEGDEGAGSASTDEGAAAGGGAPEVADLRPTDLERVAAIHRSAFPDYASSRLGVGYTRRLLRAFAARPDAWVAVARRDGRVVGYLVGAPPEAQRAVNRQLRLAAVAASLVRPTLLVGPLRTRLAARRAAPSPAAAGTDAPTGSTGPDLAGAAPDIRVVLVGVDAARRGGGVGAALLADFATRARHRGHHRADLWVAEDNAAARAAYRRAGWAEGETVAHAVRLRLDLDAIAEAAAPGEPETGTLHPD